MALFAILEKKALEKKKGDKTAGKGKKKSIEGGARELKRLQFSIKYKGRSKNAPGSGGMVDEIR